MRAILAGVMVLGLAGCGLRYIGTEDQMQQVARGTAELMKKNPYGDMVSGAGTAAHMVLSATMGEGSQGANSDCTPTMSGCLRSWQKVDPVPEPSEAERKEAAKKAMRDLTGLPDDFYKTTSIGKD